MFGAEDFGGLGKHEARSGLREKIAADAQRGIRGDAGEGIGAAAIEADGDFRRGHRHALFGGGAFDPLVDGAARGFDGGARAAGILQRHADQAIGARSARAQIMIDLIHFAAQPENDRRRNIRMIQDAAKRAPELRQIGAGRLSASIAMRERDHSVDACGQRGFVVARRDPFGGVRGAVAGGDHGDVVARAGAAVLA